MDWYRFEYQAQGSTHAHGCAKLKNDPDICGLVKKAAAAWLLENSNDMPMEDDQDIQQIFEEGKAAEKTALEYADWLVTTVNESMPDPTWRTPVPHPCAFNITSMNESTKVQNPRRNSLHHAKDRLCSKFKVQSSIILRMRSLPRVGPRLYLACFTPVAPVASL